MFGVAEDGSDVLETCYFLIIKMNFDPKVILKAVEKNAEVGIYDNEFCRAAILTLIAVLFTSSFEPINENPREFFEKIKDQEIPLLKRAGLNEEEKKLAKRYRRIIGSLMSLRFYLFDEEFFKTLEQLSLKSYLI